MTDIDSKVQNLPAEEVEKFRALCEALNTEVERIWGEEAKLPSVVIGMQYGNMGLDENLPDCLVSSSLPVCAVEDALADMMDFAHAAHLAYHGETEDEDEEPEGSIQTRTLDEVPEEVRVVVEEFAKSFGVDPSEVQIGEMVGASLDFHLSEQHVLGEN